MKRSVLPVLLLGTALAQTASPLSLNLTLNTVKTVTENGKTTEKFTPAKGNTPGDILSQVLSVTNTGKTTLTNIRIPVNVPRNTVYVAPEKGMDVARTEYSIDGGKTFAPAPLYRKLTVTENGKTVTKQVEVKPNEYQAVRYTLPELQAGQVLKFGYRVQVR